MDVLDKLLSEGGKLNKNRMGTEYIEIKGEIIAKKCNACRKFVLLDHFSRCDRSLGGRQPKCKTCFQEYRLKNKERISETHKKYVERNKERETKRKQEWYITNRDYCRRKNRKYYLANKERLNEMGRQWRARNAEKLSEYFKKYRKENAFELQKYYDRNRERINEAAKRWAKENPEKVKIKLMNRRARKEALRDDFTKEQMTAMLEHFNDCCSLTGDINIHIDHVIPLSIGHGGTTYGNMIPIRADLNISKGNKNIFEWFEENKVRYNLSRDKFDKTIEYIASINEMTVREYKNYVYWCFENKIDYSKG